MNSAWENKLPMNTIHRIFTKHDRGCHGDGTHGHQYVRERLGDLLCEASREIDDTLLESLCKPMPDDAWDEDAALKVLQGVTDPGLLWELDEGDLVLAYGHSDLYW